MTMHKMLRPLRWCKTLLLSSAAGMMSCVAAAQNAPSASGDGQADAQTLLVQQLNSGTAKERYLSSLLAPLRQLDTDQNGLDAEDFVKAEVREKTSARARAAVDFLRYDYDGDLTLTIAEIIAFSPRGNGFGEGDAAQLIAPFDTDGNGRATLQEALAAVEAKSRDRYQPDRSALLTLDTDGDGRLTASELTTLGEQTFARFDADGDGVISTDESKLLAEDQMALNARKRLREAQCLFPPAPTDADVVIASFHSGDAISSSYIEHPSVSTSVIDVFIEKGDKPLYVILSSDKAVIWRFTGATGRVQHVLANAQRSRHRDEGLDALRRLSREEQSKARKDLNEYPRSAVGATGISRDKLTIVGKHCINTPNLVSEETGKQANRIARMVSGRPAAMFAAGYSAARVSMPSGRVTDLTDEAARVMAGFDPVRWQVAADTTPGGIVSIDPRSVTAAEPVGAYEVLPGQFGIAQLLATGALEADGLERLRLVRSIPYWPAELNGGHSQRIIIANGVTAPLEGAGHSCLLTEEQAAKADWLRFCTPPPRPATIETRPQSP